MFGICILSEFCGAMKAIEIVASKDWLNLWLETDSTLMVQAFKSSSIVPSRLRNRWFNCSILIRGMNLVVSHIYSVTPKTP
jgi:ribonuclease HI